MSILVGGEPNGEYTSLARVYRTACVYLYLCIRVPQQQSVAGDLITFATLLYLARTCVGTVDLGKPGRVKWELETFPRDSATAIRMGEDM